MIHTLKYTTTIGLGLLALNACSEPAPAPAPEDDTASSTQPMDTAVEARVPTLTEAWVLEGFDAPESVIYSGQDNLYYVSVVGGEGGATDNNGAIAIISGDGELVDANWVSGSEAMALHAPKGMALWDGQLYVTDIDHLVVIDVARGEIADRIAVEGAQFLNDVTASDRGIFISDSGGDSILELVDGSVEPWLATEQLDRINGLLAQDDRLLVTTMSTGDLLSIDWETKEATVLATGMVNADGVNQRADGSYLISSWPGQLWHVREGEEPTLLQDTEGETLETSILMNDVLYHNGQLIAPNWGPGTVRAYRVE